MRVLALKKAEQTDEVIVRLVELDGKPADDVRLSFAAPVIAAREVNGVEMPVGPATVANGELVTKLGMYQPRTFAVTLAPPPAKVAMPQSAAGAAGVRPGGGEPGSALSARPVRFGGPEPSRGDAARRDPVRRHPLHAGIGRRRSTP